MMPVKHWSWLISGLRGLTEMMIQLHGDKLAMTDEQRAEFDKHLRELSRIATEQKEDEVSRWT